MGEYGQYGGVGTFLLDDGVGLYTLCGLQKMKIDGIME